jgi:hypothetical protein
VDEIQMTREERLELENSYLRSVIAELRLKACQAQEKELARAIFRKRGVDEDEVDLWKFDLDTGKAIRISIPESP